MIKIYNCGYESRHRAVFSMRRPVGTPDYTLLVVKTSAYFEVDHVLIDTPPDTAILYDKNSYVHYGCSEPSYNDDWIHFDLDDQDLSFINSLQIPFNTPCPLSYTGQLSDYARLIVLEKHGNRPYKEQILDSLMRVLLYSLASQIHSQPDKITSHKLYGILNDLRISICNMPHKKWTIENMAHSVHLSPSYFQHVYKKLFGISCMQEVIQARLKNACFYLRTTDMSIQSLAEFCGYDNELHFMRQFKKYRNMSPSQYREYCRYH